MTPLELLDLCADAVDRFEKGEVVADEPFVYLTLQRTSCPTGRFVKLHGRTGPKGHICATKKDGDGFSVVALFPALAIIKHLKEAVDG